LALVDYIDAGEELFSSDSVRPVDRIERPRTMATATRANVRGAVGGVISDVRDQGKEAVEAVADVRDNMATAIDRSLKDRPYTTLALAVGVGFLLGALWAR
jgi:ElaB/YqjD/DUF883 family membrane-anchored ribosome-binding protein